MPTNEPHIRSTDLIDAILKNKRTSMPTNDTPPKAHNTGEVIRQEDAGGSSETIPPAKLAASDSKAQSVPELLDQIDKDVFDCCDAMQNAYGTLKYRDRIFVTDAAEKAEEYLRDWAPEWMRRDTFTIDQVPEKLGTDKVREYIRSQEAELTRLRGEQKNYAREIALQAIGLFWAKHSPDIGIPTEKMIEAVDTVLSPSPRATP